MVTNMISPIFKVFWVKTRWLHKYINFKVPSFVEARPDWACVLFVPFPKTNSIINETEASDFYVEFWSIYLDTLTSELQVLQLPDLKD